MGAPVCSGFAGTGFWVAAACSKAVKTGLDRQGILGRPGRAGAGPQVWAGLDQSWGSLAGALC